MSAFRLQITLSAALLLACMCARVRAQGGALYDRGDQPSDSDSSVPKFSIFNINRGEEEDLPAERRELYIITIPRPHPQERPLHQVSLENVLGATAAHQSPAYVHPHPTHPPAPPTWNSYPFRSSQSQPYYLAIEDFRAPTPIQQTQLAPTPVPAPQTEKHFALFDVKLPAPPAIIINSYPRNHESNLTPLQDAVSRVHSIQDAILKPDIDVRSSESSKQTTQISSQTTNQDSQVRITGNTVTPVLPTNIDANRAPRGTEDKKGSDNDAVIVFPPEGDTEGLSNDDSVEVLAPLERLRRNVVALENVVGPGHVGYPVYRYPQPVYPHYPHRPGVAVAVAVRPPIPACAWGGCYAG